MFGKVICYLSCIFSAANSKEAASDLSDPKPHDGGDGSDGDGVEVGSVAINLFTPTKGPTTRRFEKPGVKQPERN